MSRVRGVVPLFVVTAIGVASGIFIFGPAFKEEQENKRQAKLLSAQSEHHASTEPKQILGAKGPIDGQAPDGLSRSGKSQESS